MSNGFYEIMPLELWQNPQKGFLAENESAIAVLSDVPANFGHYFVFPKKVVGSLRELGSQEAMLVLELVEEGAKNELLEVLERDSKRIVGFYEFSLNRAKSSSNDVQQSMLERMILNFEENPELFSSFTDFNTGANHGSNAGQSVNHYHQHMVPRFPHQVDKGVGTALYNHLN